jgi:hypothetical protein
MSITVKKPRRRTPTNGGAAHAPHPLTHLRAKPTSPILPTPHRHTCAADGDSKGTAV